MELVGISEISDMAGVTRQAVSNWRSRDPSFPKPLAELSAGPVWDKKTISEWLVERVESKKVPSNVQKAVASIDNVLANEYVEPHIVKFMEQRVALWMIRLKNLRKNLKNST